jgi:C4-type Zn-finger protein
MSLEEKRFVDDGAPLGRYRREVFCICPNCGGPALIRGKMTYAIPFWIEAARVQCLKCSFSRDWTSSDIEWRGPVIGMVCQRCSNCGYKWLTAEVWKERYSDRIKQTVKIECPVCHEVSDLKLGWVEDRSTQRPFDPYFGFPLWLQAETCGQVLWVYNKDHLHAIKAYISAAHRERAKDGTWSMMTRLPKWMKSARNRDALLKSIERLEVKLEAIMR